MRPVKTIASTIRLGAGGGNRTLVISLEGAALPLSYTRGLGGPNGIWWAEKDSNLRRRKPADYSLPRLAASVSARLASGIRDHLRGWQRATTRQEACWCHLPGSNRRPTVYKTVALPAELRWRHEAPSPLLEGTGKLESKQGVSRTPGLVRRLRRSLVMNSTSERRSPPRVAWFSPSGSAVGAQRAGAGVRGTGSANVSEPCLQVQGSALVGGYQGGRDPLGS